MSQQIKINFLDWRPDQDAFTTDGLTVADNCIHETEGYKPIYIRSASAFSTTAGLSATNNTVISTVCKGIGGKGDQLTAWISESSDANLEDTIHVGVNGSTSAAATSGYPTLVAFSTAAADSVITAFDACELAGKIFFVISAEFQDTLPEVTNSLKHLSGYMDY